jgi:GTP pyrophosphokinase
MLRLAKCCLPVPGDEICGYVSLGRGITIHRTDCTNVKALSKEEARFTSVRWEGQPDTSFRVEIQVDGWDRHRLLEDLSRTFAETGINIVEARVTTADPMIRNLFVVEVPDTRTLELTIAKLRQIDAVFDAQRVTPASR